jgi:hypothetical protein
MSVFFIREWIEESKCVFTFRNYLEGFFGAPVRDTEAVEELLAQQYQHGVIRAQELNTRAAARARAEAQGPDALDSYEKRNASGAAKRVLEAVFRHPEVAAKKQKIFDSILSVHE